MKQRRGPYDRTYANMRKAGRELKVEAAKNPAKLPKKEGK